MKRPAIASLVKTWADRFANRVDRLDARITALERRKAIRAGHFAALNPTEPAS